jgi:hypothetical protein
MAYYLTPANAQRLMNAYRAKQATNKEQGKVTRRYYVNRDPTIRFNNIQKIGYPERQAYHKLVRELTSKYHIVNNHSIETPLTKVAKSLTRFYSQIPRIKRARRPREHAIEAFRQRVALRKIASHPAIESAVYHIKKRTAERMLANKQKELRNAINAKIKQYENTNNANHRTNALKLINNARLLSQANRNAYRKRLG